MLAATKTLSFEDAFIWCDIRDILMVVITKYEKKWFLDFNTRRYITPGQESNSLGCKMYS